MFEINKNGCEVLIQYHKEQLELKNIELSNKIAELYAIGSQAPSAVAITKEIQDLQSIIGHITQKISDFEIELSKF